MEQKKPRSFRTLGRIAMGGGIVAALLVLLAPTLLSGYVGDRITREVAARVNGSVSVGEVSLGWSGPQKISALAIDGGAGVGSVRMDAEIAQGLWSLATGDAVDLRLRGNLATAVDADGGIALARLAKPGTTPVAQPDAAVSGTPEDGGALLGGRRISIELAGIDLRATQQDALLYAIEGLSGAIALSEDANGALAAKADIQAKTRVGERNGAFEASVDVRVPRVEAALDPSRLEGTIDVDATDLPLPGPADALAERLELSIDAAPERTKATLDAALRVRGAESSTIVAAVEVGPVLDAKGALIRDPASVFANIVAKVEARSVPLAILQPYVPEIAPGVRLDLVEDIGDVADISIAKDAGVAATGAVITAPSQSNAGSLGSRAVVRFDARRLRLSLEGDVVADDAGRPTGVANGVLAASLSMRPELLRSLGVDTDTPLAATASATKLAWEGPSATSPGEAVAGGLRALGGQFDVRLARSFDWKGADSGSFAAVPVRIDVLGLVMDKPIGEDAARLNGVFEARYGDVGTLKADGSGRVDLARRAITGGAFDALIGLDPTLVERLSNGAVRVGTATSNLRVAATGLDVVPGREPLGQLHAELGGALAISGGEATAMVNDLALDVTLPGASRAGSLALGAKIDGAQARVRQSFDRIPTDFSDPAALGLTGSIELAGLDPSFVARMAPSAGDRIGVLGRGPMRLSLRNKTESGALSAEFDLAAAATAARGAVRIAKDSVALRDIVCDGTLTREALASIGLRDSIELEPGARYALRVPAFAMARGEAGWAPAGDIAGNATLQDLVVRRAPGLAAPISIARIATDATYVVREERASAKGTLALGSSGGDGAVAFDLAWRKPVEARVFAGAEGTLEATALDVARLEAPLGLEPGRISGLLGGPGTLRVMITERDVATTAISAAFPRFRSQLDATLPETAVGRVANAKGSLHTEIAPDVFARLAGLAQDTKRRIVSPVTVDLAIASLEVPIDASWKPGLAGAAIDARGSISPVSIEITDERGAKSTVSTGALAVTASATRASEEIALKIATAKPANSTSADARGTLDADARLRGLFAEAEPGAASAPLAIDAVVAARGFPSATFDALGATDGAIARYLGDAIDADIDAKVVGAGTPAARGTVKASLSSPNARVEVPEVAIADGFARVSSAKPMTATLALSKPVREQLLAPIHQIFADVVTGAPARFTLANLAWPLDGDRRRFDAEFTLETGEVKLVNSGFLSWILMAAQAGRTDGFEAFIEPLRGRIAKGRLTYRDFALRAGKTTQASGTAGWKNSLVFTGDIDLASVPMRAIAITTGVPLSDAGNWSSDARRLFDSIGAVSPELLKSLVVGVKLSGPLFDAQGRPAKLAESLELPDIGDAIRRNPAGAIEAVGGIIDLFKKKDEKKRDDKKKDETNSAPKQGQPEAPKPQD
ncbi:MAG: hypothetical protein LW806_08590 [Planctomycetaceae bacterium]|nr:hypothetical protein [Planctomycetaceae bacterium]